MQPGNVCWGAKPPRRADLIMEGLLVMLHPAPTIKRRNNVVLKYEGQHLRIRPVAEKPQQKQKHDGEARAMARTLPHL